MVPSALILTIFRKFPAWSMMRESSVNKLVFELKVKFDLQKCGFLLLLMKVFSSICLPTLRKFPKFDLVSE